MRVKARGSWLSDTEPDAHDDSRLRDDNKGLTVEIRVDSCWGASVRPRFQRDLLFPAIEDDFDAVKVNVSPLELLH